MAASGEDWIAKEIYRRELANLTAKSKDKQDDRMRIVLEWLESRIKELDDKTKKSG